MDDPEGPRVRIVLPDGQILHGHLHQRHRDQDGRWWYRTTLDIPAGLAQPVPGEDYSQVPTTVTNAHPWQLESAGEPAGRVVVLHRTGCPEARGRLTPVDTSTQARLFLRHQWADPCPHCNPAP
jgi:hypothetical protein